MKFSEIIFKNLSTIPIWWTLVLTRIKINKILSTRNNFFKDLFVSVCCMRCTICGVFSISSIDRIHAHYPHTKELTNVEFAKTSRSTTSPPLLRMHVHHIQYNQKSNCAERYWWPWTFATKNKYTKSRTYIIILHPYLIYRTSSAPVNRLCFVRIIINNNNKYGVTSDPPSPILITYTSFGQSQSRNK